MARKLVSSKVFDDMMAANDVLSVVVAKSRKSAEIRATVLNNKVDDTLMVLQSLTNIDTDTFGTDISGVTVLLPARILPPKKSWNIDDAYLSSTSAVGITTNHAVFFITLPHNSHATEKMSTVIEDVFVGMFNVTMIFPHITAGIVKTFEPIYRVPILDDNLDLTYGQRVETTHPEANGATYDGFFHGYSASGSLALRSIQQSCVVVDEDKNPVAALFWELVGTIANDKVVSSSGAMFELTQNENNDMILLDSFKRRISDNVIVHELNVYRPGHQMFELTASTEGNDQDALYLMIATTYKLLSTASVEDIAEAFSSEYTDEGGIFVNNSIRALQPGHNDEQEIAVSVQILFSIWAHYKSEFEEVFINSNINTWLFLQWSIRTIASKLIKHLISYRGYHTAS